MKLIIKRFNSSVLELHAQASLNVGTGNSSIPFVSIVDTDKAREYIEALKCQYAENQDFREPPCTAPEVCTVPN